MHAEIVVLPGDGIGPEVAAAAVAVLKSIAERFNHSFTFSEHDIGGIAIDRHGEPLPASTLAACQSAQAVLLGAVGGPKWSDPNAKVRPEQGLLAIRKALGNEFQPLLARLPHLQLIGFNGQHAGRQQAFFQSLGYRTVVLPSTSPAYASLNLDQKSERWLSALRPFLSP